MLNLWMFVEAILFDYTFGITKTLYSYIYILHLFDDDNHYQVNSFQHHPNLYD